MRGLWIGSMSFLHTLLQFLKDAFYVIFVFLLCYAVYVVIARTMFHVPKFEHKPKVNLTTKDSSLGDQINHLTQANEGMTGIKAIGRGIDAFTLRMKLIESAQSSIDAKYYLWNNDLTGLMLLSAIKDAADRGVRVRLLLDDNAIEGLDPIIHQLNQHEMIDIRLYNPFVIRSYKIINFTFDFGRLNRRMHNKALIVDGVVGISGGRNIGNEYFGLDEKADFVDLDVLTVGEVMPEMIDLFELYFESELAVPADLMIQQDDHDQDQQPLQAALQEHQDSKEIKAYTKATAESQFDDHIDSGDLIDEWTDVTLVHDVPSKTLDQHDQSELMITHLVESLQESAKDVYVVSPYFIPGKYIDVFQDLSNKDISVNILTNSYQATDSAAVHTAYISCRLPLLKAGVGMFELKADQQDQQDQTNLSGSSGSSGSSSASDSSLHAKTFLLDKQTVFIGSFNFDPRSIRLNTEMGMLISSQSLATEIHDFFRGSHRFGAYEVKLNQAGELAWLENRKDNTNETFEHEPHTTLRERLMIRLVGYLPLDWML